MSFAVSMVNTGTSMGGIGRTLLVVAVFVLVAWAILESIGVQMALAWSLGLSLVLTLILHATLAIVRRF